MVKTAAELGQLKGQRVAVEQTPIAMSSRPGKLFRRRDHSKFARAFAQSAITQRYDFPLAHRPTGASAVTYLFASAARVIPPVLCPA
jgi:hypothetical protein